MTTTSMKLEKGERIAELPVEKVRIDGGTQSRAELDNGVIAEYAEHLDDLPLVIVFLDGSHYWLGDGFHRLFAHKRAKRKYIQCRVRTGTVRDAILFAVAANAEHGLKRSPEDKRHAVRMLLTDAEWSKWSDREIARQCKVSHALVAEMRRLIKAEQEREKQKKEEEAARKAQEEAEKKKAEEQARRDALKAEFAAGRKATAATNGTADAPAVTGRSSSEEPPEEERTYRTKHGTTSTMKTSGINQDRDQKSPKRKGVVIETEPAILAKLDRMTERSRVKLATQEIRRGRTMEQAVHDFCEAWKGIPVIEE